MNTPRPGQQLLHRSRQRGMTLVEWMVSITIGLFLLAGLALLFQHQSGAQLELEKSSRQIENGRYAMQLLRNDIELAGYAGEFGGSITPPGTLPDPCAITSVDLQSGLALPVQGYDVPASPPCSTKVSYYKGGTDLLVIRRADPEVITGSLTAGETYIQSGIKNQALTYVIDQAAGTGLPASFDLKKKDGASAAPVRKYLVRVYYIGTCSQCTGSNADSIPTLRVVENGGSSQPLVEGIENLQIDYGVDTTADGAPDSFSTDPGTVANWTNVMALRVHLLARNNAPTGGYSDTKTYSLGLAGNTTATNDAYKRHVFSQLIRVVNPSARRDQ